MNEVVDVGRAAFESGSWSEAFSLLSGAAGEYDLPTDDLVRVATAAYLTRVEGWDDWCARMYRECADRGDRPQAARCGFWLAFGLFSDGESVRGGGWLARAQKLLDVDGIECAERGLLLVPAGVQHLDQGDASQALAVFSEVWQFGERFASPDVVTLGCLGRGQAHIDEGERAIGLALLDEAMVAVAAREVSPPVAGLVSCAAIATCQRIFDLARAKEWTSALTRWCERHGDLVPYRGQCLVHRAEILRVHGAWPDAVEAADAACDHLRGAPAAGDAQYEKAELHRLLGEWAQAEDAYREASRAGRDPQPGLALLRLAQGDVVSAVAAIRRIAGEATGPVARARVLGPLVEISLAAGDVTAARGAVDELNAIAARLDSPFVHAAAASLTGSVELEEGDVRTAIVTLRRAWRQWQEIGVPYEAAQVRVSVATAYRQVGDVDGAAMELDAARWVFRELRAATDLERTEAASAGTGAVGGLSPREVEVLELVAAGKTNRGVAEELFISDKTVGRHVSNIFTKLGVSSRAAATAWAYEHGVTGSSP